MTVETKAVRPTNLLRGVIHFLGSISDKNGKILIKTSPKLSVILVKISLNLSDDVTYSGYIARVTKTRGCGFDSYLLGLKDFLFVFYSYLPLNSLDHTMNAHHPN